MMGKVLSGELSCTWAGLVYVIGKVVLGKLSCSQTGLVRILMIPMFLCYRLVSLP